VAIKLGETFGINSSINELLMKDTASLADALGLSWNEARLELRVILGHVLGENHAWLIANEQLRLSADALREYEQLLARRRAGEPIAYLTGAREFYGRNFRVGPEVLIPRPESELLIDTAKSLMTQSWNPDILDLGTGSGCLAITLALEIPGSRVTAVDISPSSLSLARENATALGAAVNWKLGSWFSGLRDERFDMIVSNPPYVAESDPHLQEGDVRFEPRRALAAGPSGLNDIEQIVAQSADHLYPGGWLLLEHGYDQGATCRELVNDFGLREEFTLADLAGLPRVTGARWPGNS
jgi:release factor glutamine methyltransferase